MTTFHEAWPWWPNSGITRASSRRRTGVRGGVGFCVRNGGGVFLLFLRTIGWRDSVAPVVPLFWLNNVLTHGRVRISAFARRYLSTSSVLGKLLCHLGNPIFVLRRPLALRCDVFLSVIIVFAFDLVFHRDLAARVLQELSEACSREGGSDALRGEELVAEARKVTETATTRCCVL